MGYEVLFQVSWVGGIPSEVVPIAEKHYSNLYEQFSRIELVYRNAKDANFREKMLLLKQQPSKEAIQFLKDTYCCRSLFEGDKGIVWSWTLMGNHLYIDGIIRDLIPFFQELYSRKVLTKQDRIVIICERESTETVEIFQLCWNGSKITINTFKNNDWFWGV